MPTYTLTSSMRHTLPSTMLLATASTATSGPLRLELAGPGAPARDPRLGLPDHMLAIPPVAGTWTIVARTPSGQPFPTGATVTLRVGHNDGRTQDPPSVLVSNVGLGGVDSVPLVRLTPIDAERVTVELVEAPQAVEPLAPIGEAARAAARGVLQKHGDRDRLDVTVLVDASGSMRQWNASGAVEHVVEALAGVDALLGEDDEVALAVGDLASARPVAAKDAAAACRQRVGESPLAPLFVAEAHPGGPVVVVSDSVPAGWEASQGPLVVLAESAAWPLLAPVDARGIVALTAADPQALAARLAQPGPDIQRLAVEVASHLLSEDAR